MDKLTSTITLDNLILRCRLDFTNKIRPLFVKNSCECCGATDNLELHHNKQFIELLDQALNDLNIDINNIHESDIKVVKTYMLGLQVNSNYTTLCPNCHGQQPHKRCVIERKPNVTAKTMARKANNGKEFTNAQKFLNFINSQPTGTELKKSDIQQATGLTDNQYKEVKRNPAVKNWINTHKSGQKFIV